jgi:methanogenic corrinoid protein MtbC1
MNPYLGEQLRASADDAIAMTIERQCRLHPELRQRFGERGLKHWREDIGHHIDYLRAAVDSGRNQPFADYLRWVAEVLERRGVELDHLHHSLDDLAEFYRDRFAGDALEQILGVLAAGRAALAEPAALPAEYRLLPPPLPEKDSYLDLLLASRRVEAQRLVSACMTAGASLATVNVRLIQIAMYDIGLLWQSNRISVAQEHLATAVSQSVMANAFAGARFAAPLGRTAVFANVEGNHHALGLRMISDAFETAGWTARFLGADVPQPSLFSLVDAERPDLLGLSVSMPQQLEMARGIIGRLRAEMGQTCPAILLGGRTINALDNIWRDLGADLWARDAEQAELQATGFGS